MKKSILAILIAFLMLATIFSVITVNAANNDKQQITVGGVKKDLPFPQLALIRITTAYSNGPPPPTNPLPCTIWIDGIYRGCTHLLRSPWRAVGWFITTAGEEHTIEVVGSNYITGDVGGTQNVTVDPGFNWDNNDISFRWEIL